MLEHEATVALARLQAGERVEVVNPDNGERFAVVGKLDLGRWGYGVIPWGRKRVIANGGCRYRLMSREEAWGWLCRLDLMTEADRWGKRWGLWRTPDGFVARMYRGKHNRCRWWLLGNWPQWIGPEQVNVAPAVAWATAHGWQEATEPDPVEDTWADTTPGCPAWLAELQASVTVEPCGGAWLVRSQATTVLLDDERAARDVRGALLAGDLSAAVRLARGHVIEPAERMAA